MGSPVKSQRSAEVTVHKIGESCQQSGHRSQIKTLRRRGSQVTEVREVPTESDGDWPAHIGLKSHH